MNHVRDAVRTADDIFSALEGEWCLNRNIEAQATMQGRAQFTRLRQDILAYHEEGNLRLASGTKFNAERDYIFERRSNGFAVFFPETPPRLFHSVNLKRAEVSFWGTATHLCKADFYETRYDFYSRDLFVIEHRVSGPRKDYSIRSEYQRLHRSELS
ncbi:MAG: hypothetical protein IKE42_15960 [Aquamicrobium sp.]|nr:hypothetical protein [Aquamicrobium sp.]